MNRTIATHDADTGASPSLRGDALPLHGAASSSSSSSWPRALIDAARFGEREAVRELTRRIGAPLYRLALNMLCEPALADRVVRETFDALEREIRLLHTHEGFDRWLWALASEQCLRAANPEARSYGPRAGWAHALAALSPVDRLVYLLCDVEGLAYDDAAWILEEDPPATRRRVCTARQALRAAAPAD